MEMGVDAVLMNTAIAAAKDPLLMAEAMQHAVLAGRQAFLAGRMQRKLYATASSPLEGIQVISMLDLLFDIAGGILEEFIVEALS